MNFRDTWATDEDGNEFIFTVEMQRKLSQAGLPVEPESLSQLPDDTSKKSHKSAQSNASSKTKAKKAARKSDDSHVEPDAIQIDPQTGKYIGCVKWYNISKGYGFIARGGGEDIFFHKTDIVCEPGELNPGVWVLYDVEETPKGLEASDVELYENR